MVEPRLPTEFERRLLDDAMKVVGEINGSPVTNLDRIWMKLKTMMENPVVAKMVIQHYKDAIEADTSWRTYMVNELLEYKAHWGPIFYARRQLGQRVPYVFPDPDDIVIKSPTDFTFIGPVTEEEARDWEFFRKGRAAFYMYAQEIIDGAGHFYSIEKGREDWAKLRRQYYRVNRHLPAAFKKKYPARFPPFDPPAVFPE